LVAVATSLVDLLSIPSSPTRSALGFAFDGQRHGARTLACTIAVLIGSIAVAAPAHAATDTTAASLTAFSAAPTGATLTPSGHITISYSTSESVSPIYFGFKDSVGNARQFQGSGGSATIPASGWANGAVQLTYVDMFDAAGNRTTYRPGSVSFTPSGGTGPTTNPFDFSTATFTVAEPPNAPANVSAEAKGDLSAYVSWTAPGANGSPITQYTLTAHPGGQTETVLAPTTHASIGGLSDGVSYTFTVVARNLAGDSQESVQSNPIVAGLTPSIPSVVNAVAHDRSAALSWTASSGNGSQITSYAITSNPGGRTVTVSGEQTSAIVTGLSNGATYTFTVTATNAVGTSAPSTPSNAATPARQPGSPRIGSARSGGAGGRITATAAWLAPASNGGAQITGYCVTAIRYNQDSAPVANFASHWLPASARSYKMVLPRRGRYRFRVIARNDVGRSSPSQLSNIVNAR